MPNPEFQDLDVTVLQKAIADNGFTWRAQALPANYVFPPLGNNASPPEFITQALQSAERLKVTHLARFFQAPNIDLKALPEMLMVESSPAPASRPATFDWRSRGKIGPVTDQRWCGSCVSFATTGLVGAMAAIEQNIAPLLLSQADLHFCSSHHANCTGWNNGTAVDQVKSRGVVSDGDLAYMAGFDNPPKGDPNDNPDHLWLAYCRTVPNRENKAYYVLEASAWNGDDRKTYLANVGPLICGFKVYTDFDSYGQDAHGVYRHAAGKERGGHAVLVVGYSDTERCWICRNSWGAGWGGAAKPKGVGAGFFKIGYGDSHIDDEAFFGVHGVLSPAPVGWGGWWAVAGGVAAPNSSVYGVSRSADKLDIFCVGTDMRVWSAAWQPSSPAWAGWWALGTQKAAASSSPTVVSRAQDKLDVFCVGADHHIVTAHWEPNTPGWTAWAPVAGGIAAANTSVFGVSRSQNKLDIFCVGTDHGIYTAAWEPGNTNWQGWWRLQNGVAAPNTSVSAVTRAPDKLDVFCVGTDHRVYASSWQPSAPTWTPWTPINGGVAAPNTSVSGISRRLDYLDIFCIGTDLRVWTAAKAGNAAWAGWWAIGTLKVAPGTSVSVVSKGPDQLDIFVVGADGKAYTAHWDPTTVSWHGWYSVLNGKAAPGTVITAVSRSANHVDVFCAGTDHHVYTAARNG